MKNKTILVFLLSINSVLGNSLPPCVENDLKTYNSLPPCVENKKSLIDDKRYKIIERKNLTNNMIKSFYQREYN